MNVTLNLPPDVEQAYLAQAQAKGVSLEQLIRDIVLSHTPTPVLPNLPADQWVQEFRNWVHSHPRNTPLLSDEAISREFIYGERGL